MNYFETKTCALGTYNIGYSCHSSIGPYLYKKTIKKQGLYLHGKHERFCIHKVQCVCDNHLFFFQQMYTVCYIATTSEQQQCILHIYIIILYLCNEHLSRCVYNNQTYPSVLFFPLGIKEM